MNRTETSRKVLLYLLCAWAVVIVVPLVHVPLPMFVTGHPWRAELALSIYATAAAGAGLMFGVPAVPQASRRMMVLMAAFGAFGFASALWAGSFISVVQHTLMWALYLMFFAVAAHIVNDRRLLRGSLYALGAASVIVGAICTFEFLLRPSLDQSFGFRYARYAEIGATLLPLFVSLALRLKGRNLVLAGTTVSLLFLLVLCAGSRTAVVGSAIGMIVFGALSLWFERSRHNLKNAAAVACILIAAAAVAQIPALISPSRSASVARFASSADPDPSNSIGQNVRRQFIGVGLEMVKANPVRGLGADNFGLEFNKYRAVYSQHAEDKAIAAYGEDSIPERTHNEYLQVLTETGILGFALFAAMLAYLLYAGFSLIREPAESGYRSLRIAAFAGTIAFLASSAFSSYSFRLGQNGIAFFFLAALLLRSPSNGVQAERSRTTSLVFLVIAVVCIGYFGVRGYSQYLVNAAERTRELSEAASTFDTAARLDPSNASAHFSYGFRLLGEHDFPGSAQQFRLAVDNGINSVTAYSYLITALYLSGETTKARDAAAEAVTVFPYSVFMQTRLGLLESELGDQASADRHLAAASDLDQKMAITWRLMVSKGANAAAEAGRRGEGVDLLYKLQPENAMWAVIAEREIRFPDEKFSFPTPEN